MEEKYENWKSNLSFPVSPGPLHDLLSCIFNCRIIQKPMWWPQQMVLGVSCSCTEYKQSPLKNKCEIKTQIKNTNSHNWSPLAILTTELGNGCFCNGKINSENKMPNKLRQMKKWLFLKGKPMCCITLINFQSLSAPLRNFNCIPQQQQNPPSNSPETVLYLNVFCT